MKKTTKIVAAFAAAALAFGVAPAATAANATKACLALDTGGVDDKSFNASAWAGANAAKKANANVSVSYLAAATDADYAPNIKKLVDNGCDIIVGVGFLINSAIVDAAKKNPSVKFAIVDQDGEDHGADGSVYPGKKIANLKPLEFATNESAFQAGYLAAGVSKTGKVATYGGLNIPPVTIFMDGFAKGVAYYNAQKGTTVKVLGWDTAKQDGTFAGNFQSLDDGKNIAKSQADEGADIIFPVAGPVGLGSAQFAMESGGKVKIIGVDVDMSVSNPDAAEVYIASVLKNIDAAVLAAITDTVNGVKTSDNYVGTLANGGVGVAYTAVPAELQAEVEAIGQGIADGTIKI